MVFKRMKEWYRTGYLKNPYRFAFGTMFCKSIIADSFAQLVLEKNISHTRKAKNVSQKRLDSAHDTISDVSVHGQRFDFKRMLRFGIWGGLYCGFIEHWIYNVLFTKLWPQPILINAFKKMVVDLFIHCPFLYFPVYYIAKSMILGNSISNGIKQYKDEWYVVNIECWKIWIPVQFGIFYFCSIPFRLITMGIVSLFWMSYLSFLSPMVHDEQQSVETYDKTSTVFQDT
eukprot:11326_1